MSGHEAKNLVHPSVSSKGWISREFCLYPQTLGFDLKSDKYVYRIQLLFHHIFIPEKIDVLIGDREQSGSRPRKSLTLLGTVFTQPKSQLTIGARELKSVEIDCNASYVQLVLHKNHLHKDNLCNQVGLMAVLFYGRKLNDSRQIPDGGLTKSPLEDSGVDLANSMYIDAECIDLIDKLRQKEKSAAKNERYAYADNCQKAASVLHKGGELLARYSCQKTAAAEKQNFDSARWHQRQEEHLRHQLLNVLPIQQLLENKQRRHENDKVMNFSLPKPLPRPSSNNEKQKTTIESKKHPISTSTPKEPLSSQKNSASSIDKHISTLPSTSPTLTTKQKQRMKRNEAFRNSPDEASETSLPAVVKPRRRQKNLQKNPKEFHAFVSNDVSAQVMNQDHSLPRIRSKSMAGLMVGDSGSGSPSSLQFLDNDRLEANLAIEVFGKETVEQIYNKNFEVKERALRSLLESLRTDDRSVKAERKTRACTFLLKRTIKDKVHSTFLLSCEVFVFLIGPYATIHRTHRRALVITMESILPELLLRCADNAQRTSSLGVHTIVKMADSAVSRDLQPVLSRLTEPVTTGTNQRVAQARLDIVDQMTTRRLNDSLISRVVQLAVSCLRHASESVRSSASQLLLKLYPDHHKIVRQSLPSERKFRTTLTYRQLAAKMDALDAQRIKAEKQNAKSSNEEKLAAAAGEKQVNEADQPSEADIVPGGQAAAANISPSLRGRSRSLSQLSLREGNEKRSVHTACLFCGALDASFSNSQRLENHYGTDCPMLVTCRDCGQTVEVSALTEHRLRECERKESFDVCTRCLEAIPIEEHKEHVDRQECIPGKAGPAGNRCPLCHQNCAPYESGWRYHLLNQCQQNLRQRRKPRSDDLFKAAEEQSADKHFQTRKPGSYSMDPQYVDRKRRGGKVKDDPGAMEDEDTQFSHDDEKSSESAADTPISDGNSVDKISNVQTPDTNNDHDNANKNKNDRGTPGKRNIKSDQNVKERRQIQPKLTSRLPQPRRKHLSIRLH